MRNVLLVAKREYLEQIRGRAFRMTTVGLPAVFALVVAVGYFSSLGLGSHKHLVVVSNNAVLAGAVRAELLGDRDAKSRVDVMAPASEQDRDLLKARVQSRAVDGVVAIDARPTGLPAATYISQSSGDFITGGRIRQAVNHALLNVRLTGAGLAAADAEALEKGIPIETFRVKDDGAVVRSNAQASLWKGYVMAFLLSMTTMIYGMNVARSIIQEKTSRIFEVMLAIAKPSDMLAGKLVGVGAVGLTQIAIWLVALGVILVSPFSAALTNGDFAIEFSWAEAVLFPIYFVLGFLLYSSLFAGLAATCETEQELQMYMPLAAAPTWLSFAMILVIINDSNSLWSVAASCFPPTAPVTMFLRMASQMPPAWQFALSIGLMMVSIWAVLWMSSKLYRVGILMYGKRATLPELLRWIRYS